MKIEAVIKKHVPDDGQHIWGLADLTGLLHPRFRGFNYGIVVGKKLDDAIVNSVIDGPTMPYYEQYVNTNKYLSSLVAEIAADLKSLSINSLAINPTDTEVDRAEDYEQTLRNTFSHKMVATRAGLGWIGKTDLFISKKWGPRLRLVSVLVDHPLKPLSRPIDDSRCGNCKLCVEVCPAQAATGQLWNINVDRDEFYSARKCKETANRLSLERIGKDARICGICVSVCPVGKKGRYTGDVSW
ncbi:MAG TPA: 4Fe-4S double cluster binding domain-containing protein [Dehalococcoidia bacterium]|jgi:epoxyqueuosine reductase QueG